MTPEQPVTRQSSGSTAPPTGPGGARMLQAHELALHCAFAKPRYLAREEVSAEAIEKERYNLLEITKAEGKPEAAWPKIVEGRVNAWLAGQVLLEQGVHGEKETVAQRIGSGRINRFAMAVIGS